MMIQPVWPRITVMFETSKPRTCHTFLVTSNNPWRFKWVMCRHSDGLTVSGAGPVTKA